MKLTFRIVCSILSFFITSVVLAQCPSFGRIAIDGGSACINNRIDFVFQTESNELLQLTWTFFDTNGTTVLQTGGDSSFTYMQPGTYNISLEVLQTNGCKTLYSQTITIGRCGKQQCDIHFSFNFKIPISILNTTQRLAVATDINNFFSEKSQQNTSDPLKRLFVTSYDDSQGNPGRVSGQHTLVNAALPILAPTAEIRNAYFRMQDTNYSDTYVNTIQGMMVNPAVTNDIDISFFVASQYNYSSASAVATTKSRFDELVANPGGKSRKIFFIFCNEGLNYQTSDPVAFAQAMLGRTPIEYNPISGSVLNSDYVILTKAQIDAAGFEGTLTTILRNAYDEVSAAKCPPLEACTKNNILSENVENKLQNLIKYLITVKENGMSDAMVNTQNPPEMIALQQYITDPDARIYNFLSTVGDDGNLNSMAFSFNRNHFDDVKISGQFRNMRNHNIHMNLELYESPEIYLIQSLVFPAEKVNAKISVRHIDFCPKLDCSKLPHVKKAFIKLLNRLHAEAIAGNPNLQNSNGFECDELTQFKSFVTDPDAKIYNFVPETFSFSFHRTHAAEEKADASYDVMLDNWRLTDPEITDMDLSGFEDPSQYLVVGGGTILTDGQRLSKTSIRHVNFCPDTDCTLMPEINSRFITLLNYLQDKVIAGEISDMQVAGGYSCPPLTAFLSNVTDLEARIYNFSIEPFSFSFHQTPISPRAGEISYDVTIKDWKMDVNNHIESIDLTGYSSPEQFLPLINSIVLENHNILPYGELRHVEFCPDELDGPCSLMPEVNAAYIALLNELHNIIVTNNGDASTIVNGFTCQSLINLREYISDPTAKIYNFSANPFFFSFHPNEKDKEDYDVFIEKWNHVAGSDITAIDLSTYSNPFEYTDLSGRITKQNGSNSGKSAVRHIDFCPDVDQSCPTRGVVKDKFLALLNHLHEFADQVGDGYDCQQLSELRGYLGDQDAFIYNFQEKPFSFSFHKLDKLEEPRYDVILEDWYPEMEPLANVELTGYAGYTNFTNLDFKFTTTDGIIIKSAQVRHVNFCPPAINYCITNNQRADDVKNRFIALLNELHHDAGAILPDGIPPVYSCASSDFLSPYITDKKSKIYNFDPDTFSFSFHDNKNDGYDVSIQDWPISDIRTVTGIDFSDYQSPTFMTSLNQKITMSDGSKLEKGFVRHVNLCPDDICVNHIAIVADESGSLTPLEKGKIKRQLLNFVHQQANFNASTFGNMHLSLIGMSDCDENIDPLHPCLRTDNIISKKITNDPLVMGIFESWIQNYGSRYGQTGISEGSDYWNSGLRAALNAERKPDLVIMITDGCQTANVETLKATVREFDNYYGDDHSTVKPHLYVMGIDNGFYVYDDETNKMVKNKSEDPNFTPQLRSNLVASSVNSVSVEGDVTTALKKSLKYLLGYPNPQFPKRHADDFHMDYFGHEDFKIIGEDLSYISDRLVIAEIGCGKESEKNPCDDCFSFKPVPGKTYVLDAWAKQELNTQMVTYPDAQIKVVYRGQLKNLIHENDLMPFKTSGKIIDGWQRIGGKFTVPEDTYFIDFELINTSLTMPVYIDDVRVYPIKGTMKSFVYDPETFRLMAEQDENNYSTYYEYDNEGGLVRVKKETAEGVKTIKETRSGTYIQPITPTKLNGKK